MNKNLLFIGLVLAFVSNSFAQVEWEVDKPHTNARFEVKHTGISFIDGAFTKIDGAMETKSEDDFNGAVLNYTIDVNSVHTREDARDAHLLTDDFFDAEQYPEMTLKDAKLEKKEGANYELKGALTIKDVSKEVVFDVVKNGTITDDQGNLHVGFTATTTIDRTDFNINYNDKLPNGIDAVGKDIKIVVNTELIKE